MSSFGKLVRFRTLRTIDEQIHFNFERNVKQQ